MDIDEMEHAAEEASLTESIRAATDAFDPKDDAHWTAAGLPDLGHMRAITGDQTVGRRDVTSALPNFNRDAAIAEQHDAPIEPPSPEDEPDEPELEAPADVDLADFAPDPEDTFDRDRSHAQRGAMMCILMSMPRTLRRMADADKLSEMVTFVTSMPTETLAEIAVDMLKVVAKEHPQDIASGQYRDRILAGLELVTEAPINPNESGPAMGVPRSESQQAAKGRLDALAGVTVSDDAADREALRTGTDAENDAHKRLYG